LQAQTKSKLLENGKMCKDKWNSIHDDYKKISNYQKDTRNNTSYWDLLAKNQHQHHLPWQFNEDCYNAFKTLQGERNVNAPLPCEKLVAIGNGMYSQTS
jgi:hypothetical protein